MVHVIVPCLRAWSYFAPMDGERRLHHVSDRLCCRETESKGCAERCELAIVGQLLRVCEQSVNRHLLASL